MGKPARRGLDRSRHARHHQHGLHSPRREGWHRGPQRGDCEIREREGPGEGTLKVAMPVARMERKRHPGSHLGLRPRDHSVIAIETLPQIVTIRPESDPLVKPVTLGKERLAPVVVSVPSIRVEGEDRKAWLRTIYAGINRTTPVTERKQSRRPTPSGVGRLLSAVGEVALNRSLA